MRKIKFYFILLFCLSSMLNANSDYIDKTHEIVENYLYTTSDYLDKAISREDYKVKNKTLLSGELSYASVVEKSTPSYNNLKLRIRLLFPRLRDNYKLTLENYNENNSIDNVNQHNRYLLGLTKGKSRVGVKFRGISPDLFISYKLFDDYPLKYQFNFHIENKIMYFVDYKLDNTLQMNFSKMVNDSM
ncbi:MAG: hypothetical protein U9R16_02915, partial [Campylobacterota bacterium]|nr:hypothetical protein [Campylobacterota bacterium]